jgi:hypothetical protein
MKLFDLAIVSPRRAFAMAKELPRNHPFVPAFWEVGQVVQYLFGMGTGIRIRCLLTSHFKIAPFILILEVSLDSICATLF